MKMARGDQPIATVVPRPYQHQHALAACFSHPFYYLVGHCASGILH